jgi:nicotinamidase-related amidase
MLLNAVRSQFIVVDMQARLMPAIAEADRVLRNVDILLRSASRLDIPVTVAEQYPKGLGPTVPSVSGALPEGAVVFAKTTFSAAAAPEIAGRITMLRASGRDQAVLCGVEAHVCVLQTALDLKTAGMNVFVVGDAVSSRSDGSVHAACARLLHAGCHWITTEMAVFEWLGRAATDDFRALSPLIK